MDLIHSFFLFEMIERTYGHVQNQCKLIVPVGFNPVVHIQFDIGMSLNEWGSGPLIIRLEVSS